MFPCDGPPGTVESFNDNGGDPPVEVVFSDSRFCYSWVGSSADYSKYPTAFKLDFVQHPANRHHAV